MNGELTVVQSEAERQSSERESALEQTRWSEERLAKALRQCEELRHQIETCEEDKQRALKDVTDRLTHDYKADLEGLRSRFRLMTVMERSPSDSSLERIEVCC